MGFNLIFRKPLLSASFESTSAILTRSIGTETATEKKFDSALQTILNVEFTQGFSSILYFGLWKCSKKKQKKNSFYPRNLVERKIDFCSGNKHHTSKLFTHAWKLLKLLFKQHCDKGFLVAGMFLSFFGF